MSAARGARIGFAMMVACVVALAVVSWAGGTATAQTETPLADAQLDARGQQLIHEVRANFTPESRKYWSIRTALSFFSPVYAVITALLLLFTRISSRMRDVAHRFNGRYLRTLVYVALFVLVSFVIDFPLSVYTGYLLEHRFGLSNQTFGAWLGEEGKGLLVAIVLFGATGIVALAYKAIQKSPRRWWLWLAAGTLPVILLLIVVTPVFIDPLFNKFVPLKNQDLKSKIIALAEKAEIPGRNVYEVDRSKQTKKYNAYVNGFGPSQRIVLWDTILQGMQEDEILFVMGHEMGHYKLAHIWKGVLFYSVLSIALFWFAWWSMNRAVARWGPRWGFTELHDLASMPLLAMTLAVASFVSQPLSNSFSRAIEHESDVFGVEVTRLNDAAARAFIKLGSQNRSNPEPPAIVKIFLYTHPPLIERIRFAYEYRPWQQGRPNKAFKPKK